MAANAHPDVVRQVVELCLDARKAYKNSGIQDVVQGLKDHRAVVEFVDERRFVKIKTEKAKSLKEWLYYKDCLKADCCIGCGHCEYVCPVGGDAATRVKRSLRVES